MFRSLRRLAGLVAASWVLALPAHARDDIRTERVHFARGSSSAVVEASIAGYEVVDYVLRAGEGQHMKVGMATDNGANTFNILAPGETEVAFFNGSLSQNRFEGTLSESGDYRIRVYLERSAARRNERASYRIEIAVDEPAAHPTPEASSDRGETAIRAVAKPDPGGYRTVCGVFVDGRPIRYVCSVVAGDQRRTPTTLRFPDMVLVLHWLDGKRVQIELEGMKPLEGTWSESEGETDITTPEKTWFYISDREMAAREVGSMAP